MRHLLRTEALEFNCLLAALLIAVSSSGWGAEADAYKFEKDHPNFPQVNPHPRQTFMLQGTSDPGLDLVFYSTWTVVSSEAECRSGDNGLFVAIPLPVSWGGSHFSGVVAIDGMLPGRCNWKFADVRVAPRGAVVNLGYAFGGQTIVQTNSPHLAEGASPNTVRHLQCAVSQSSDREGKVVGCNPQFPPAWWYPTTSVIEFEFRRRM
jgi:hypothetical protein